MCPAHHFFLSKPLCILSQSLRFAKMHYGFSTTRFFTLLQSQIFRRAGCSSVKNDTSILKQKCFVLQKGHTGIFFFPWHLFSWSKCTRLEPSPSFSPSALGNLFLSLRRPVPYASQPGNPQPSGLGLGDNEFQQAELCFLHHLAFRHVCGWSFLSGLGDLLWVM